MKYKKGNKDGPDIYVVSFHHWLGANCCNCPIPQGLPYGRRANEIYFKTNCVTNEGFKARHCMAITFKKRKDANSFEQFFIKITGSECCL